MQVGLPWHHLYTSQRGADMAGESHCITFQHVIVENEVPVISPDSLKEIQCRRPNWYFSRRELEDISPSRKDGIDLKKEAQLRGLYCSFVQDLGMKLKVPQLTIATAMMFCHRFYLHQSHAKNDWQTIATVSIFLACKVEETPRPLVDVICAAYEMLHRSDRVSSQRIKQKDVFEKQKKLILIGERLLMATIGFDFNVQHPYKPLVAALKKLDISHKDLAQVAWNFVNDWLRTTLCLQYKPHYIAAGSIYLAAKFCKVKLPSERGNVWWQEFEVSYHQLEEVIKHMLKSLGENKRVQKSSSHQNGTCDTLVKKATIYSPQTNTLNGYKATSESMHATEEKALVCGSYRQSSDASLKNKTFPGEDSCVVRSRGLSLCQTSDSGSSRSVVEDGNRTDDDGDREKLVKPNQIAACMIVSECRGDTDNVLHSGIDKKTEVGVESDDASLYPSQDAASEVSQYQTNDLGCSQSVFGDDNRTDVENTSKFDEPNQIGGLNMISELGINIDIDVKSGIKENSGLGGESRESNDAGFHNSQSVLSEDTCVLRSEVSNSQTSNGVSNENAVSDGNRIVDCEDLAKLDLTDQPVASNTFSDSGTKIDKGPDCGGLSNIDTDRIKEALRKRKREKLAKKERAASDGDKDNDSWIVEELENGIELAVSSVQKRQKL